MVFVSTDWVSDDTQPKADEDTPPTRTTSATSVRRECEYVLWGSHGLLPRSSQPVYLRGWLTGSRPRKDRLQITQKEELSIPVDEVLQAACICSV